MKRSKEFRIHQKDKKIKKRFKDILSNKGYSEKLKESLNKLNKKHPFDCGNPNCGICRMDKKSYKKKQARKLPLIDKEDCL